MMSPTSPRWTPSGLIIIKVRSRFADIVGESQEKSAKSVAIIQLRANNCEKADKAVATQRQKLNVTC